MRIKLIKIIYYSKGSTCITRLSSIRRISIILHSHQKAINTDNFSSFNISFLCQGIFITDIEKSQILDNLIPQRIKHEFCSIPYSFIYTHGVYIIIHRSNKTLLQKDRNKISH